jgi:hypothetical protein
MLDRRKKGVHHVVAVAHEDDLAGRPAAQRAETIVRTAASTWHGGS